MKVRKEFLWRTLMKITDLQLEDYGIYKKVSIKPPQNQLVVVMGQNESGKTTLLHFIRDMLFGFSRGNWKGRKGNMAFIRSNGDTYRLFRHEKDTCFIDAANEKYTEELPELWWHGLTRSMYEHIFAVGLEDLQGTRLLTDESVKSRFFMMQGGDHLNDAKEVVQKQMGDLLIASLQGKRKINMLLLKKRELDQEISLLSTQETKFAVLQKRQSEVTEQLKTLKNDLKNKRDTYRALGKRLGAWEYYKKAKEIKRGLDLSKEVKVFPSNGKEQWNKLMGRMKVIHEQKEALQGKIDSYTPKQKEQIIPWVGLEQELEQLYVDLGQWKQTLLDGEDLSHQRDAWCKEHSHLGYTLSLWGEALNPSEEWKSINWEDGRLLAKGVSIRQNELHFWEQREPHIEELPDIQTDKGIITDEKEWNAFENNAIRLEELIREESNLSKNLVILRKEAEKKYTIWFWMGFVLLMVATAGIGAFFAAFSGTIALYIAAGCLGVGIFFLFINAMISRLKNNKLHKALNAQSALAGERKNIVDELPVEAPESEEDLQTFHNVLQEMRSTFYQTQASLQALSWKKETIRQQEETHNQWKAEGELLKKAKTEAINRWEEWLTHNKLPVVPAEKLSQLQEEWQKIYASKGKGKIIDALIEKNKKQLQVFEERAICIINVTGVNLSVHPETIAGIYEENRNRSLQWQSISEKNKQHEVFLSEMKKLEKDWNTCQKEMQTLMDFVHATTAEEFAERVTAHEHHDQLLKDWANIKQDLRFYAGSDEEYHKLWTSLQTGKYDTWMTSYEQLKVQIEEGDIQLAALQKEAGALENEIFRLAKDESITKKLQERQETISDLQMLLCDWMKYKYTDYLIAQAQKKYEIGKRPAVLKQANEFLQAMTANKYSLVVNEEGDDVVLVDKTHNRKNDRIWSSGTGDQVYLSIRLAMALAFGKQVETLPIVLDDIFVRFDEDRQRQTLRFLMELGKEQQIFLFTCHKRTMEIAQEVGKELQTGAFIRLQSGQVVTDFNTSSNNL